MIRWLHIYSSLLGFMTVLFFGFTGLTLNHPDWFGGLHESVREEKGLLPESLIPLVDMGVESQSPQSQSLQTLAIVEHFRAQHQITASVRDFQADETQVSIAFAGPGYTADVWIDRPTHTYQLTETRLGLVAVINDLHKGRDTGTAWSVVIDVSAVILVLISATGLILLVWLRRRWRTGLLTLVGGTVLFSCLVWWSLA